MFPGKSFKASFYACAATPQRARSGPADRYNLPIMTRINCIPVEELSAPHLVAEYRELPRVFALAHKAAARGDPRGPACYTLGTGHVRFFYVRLAYLARRHQALVAEMRRRGYQPRFEGIRRTDFPEIPDACWQDWTPTPEAMALNRARIAERNAAAAAGRQG